MSLTWTGRSPYPQRRRNKGHGSSIVRILALAKRIEGYRMLCDVEALAQEFGVCTRTIHRDLRTLEAAGWPVPQFRYEARRAMEMAS